MKTRVLDEKYKTDNEILRQFFLYNNTDEKCYYKIYTRLENSKT